MSQKNKLQQSIENYKKALKRQITARDKAKAEKKA